MDDQSVMNSKLLIDAAREGDVSEVKRLIPISIPHAWENLALCNAVTHGKHDVVHLLIAVCDVQLDDSKALRGAVKFGEDQMIDLLYPISDPRAALKRMQRNHEEHECIRLSQRIKAQDEHQVLSCCICSVIHAKSSGV